MCAGVVVIGLSLDTFIRLVLVLSVSIICFSDDVQHA